MSDQEYMDMLRPYVATFISRPDMDLSQIKHTGSWHIGEFQIGSRIYCAEDKTNIVYGPGWDKQHIFRDFGNIRVSTSVWFHPHKNGWHLCIGTERVFDWNKRKSSYAVMSKAQCMARTSSFASRIPSDVYLDPRNGGATAEDLFNAIYFELWERFGKRWYN